MKKSKLISFFLIFYVINTFSQGKSIDSLYVKYFNNEREIPYLHLNKTSFFEGEEVWFKAYVLNMNNQKLHKKTKNLYCTMYNEKGEIKDNKLLHVIDGMAYGSFKIDSTFTGENYFLRASTNYMKNFKEDESFVQKIQIVNNKEKITSIQAEKNSYDLQILPEGGHLLANSLNCLGIILKDRNGNVPDTKKGEIVDGRGKVVKEFTFNQFGLSKISLVLESDKEYEARVYLDNGELITSLLPKKELKGVSLAFEDISSNMTKFTVNTNLETIKDLAGKKYYLLIHNTNAYLKREVNFKLDATSYTFYFNKKLFTKGTNIATLFTDDYQPIGERVFFNYKESLFNTVNLSVTEVSADAVTVNVKSKEDVGTYFLSASVLPQETKTNNSEHDIYSKFLLAPYINGNVKNSEYFFKDVDRKKLQELDLVLLTQGWSKYNWYNIFNTPPVDVHEFESGITVKGTLNMDHLGVNVSDIFLTTDTGNVFTSSVKDNQFEFKNLFVKDTSSIRVSYNNKRGILKQPKAYLRFIPSTNSSTRLNIEKVKSKEFISVEDEVKIPTMIGKDELLNEVEVKGKRKFTNNPILFGLRDSYKMEDYKSWEGRMLFELIRTKGYRLIENPFGEIKFESRRYNQLKLNGAPPKQLKAPKGNESLGGNGKKDSDMPTKAPSLEEEPGLITAVMKPTQARIFVDRIEVTQDFAALALLRLSLLREYDEIFISNSPISQEIHLFTKKDKFIGKKNYLEYKLPLAFSVEKEYYQPKYVATESKAFREYGALHWEPNITLNKEEREYTLTFPRLHQESIRVSIQGITENGALITTEKILTIDNK
ncbi:hypothetical protein [Tenacibaculum agarivorans]|uniref:hypothetical protein n=1 Tax=Tenacibaculum agarivorans TaxID=1908389 RepID=UPI00094B8356|nr:hypothetical protein [Tenacibaculum agarivorans]